MTKYLLLSKVAWLGNQEKMTWEAASDLPSNTIEEF